jgi:dihydrodipicolinate reductase
LENYRIIFCEEITMDKPKVLFHGFGGMGQVAAKHIFDTHRYKTLPVVYDASEKRTITIDNGKQTFVVINSDPEYEDIPQLIKGFGRFTMIDFATSPKMSSGTLFDPSLPDRFIEMCCRYGINFIRGSTQPSSDHKALERMIEKSGVSAVIAPNMAPPIVAFQSTIEKLAKLYAGTAPLEGCTLHIVESHQSTKTDTSGTARAMIEKPNGQKGYFNQLGIQFKESDIVMIRDRKEYAKLGIPENYFGGHGWHSYILQKKTGRPDGIDSLIRAMKNFIVEDNAKVFSDYELRGRFASLSELHATVQNRDLHFDIDRKPGDASQLVPDCTGIMPNLKYLEKNIGREIDAPYAVIRISETVGIGMLYKPGQTCVIIHNVNGRDVYGTGVVRALDYSQTAQKGKISDMVDVLWLR